MNTLNIAPLFETLRNDVEAAMLFLGFNVVKGRPMPEVKIIPSLKQMGLSPVGECYHGGYDVVTNIIYIPEETFQNPATLHMVMSHELTHSLQCEDRIATELFLLAYRDRGYEKEAYQIQMLVTGLTLNHRVVKALTRQEILTKTNDAWINAMY